MKQTSILLRTLIISSVCVFFLSGCGKKTEKSSAPAPTAETPALASGTRAATSSPVAAPTFIPDSRLAESQAAIKANDYEKAAAALVSLQQARLNEQQAAAMTAQMQQLQRSLSSAVASGDPRAKAAAAKLRQSTPQ